jgi:hypothetical protein
VGSYSSAGYLWIFCFSGGGVGRVFDEMETGARYRLPGEFMLRGRRRRGGCFCSVPLIAVRLR